jgi:AcrR family transcriptional regulator
MPLPISKSRTPDLDLSSGARIRNAALKLFADRGISASSIRAIAKAAGVSPGLVQHLFKTKNELQTAIEVYVFEKVAELGAASLAEESEPGRLRIGRQIVEFIRENPDTIKYARRVILEDDVLGRRLFDQIVAIGRTQTQRLLRQGFLRPDVDIAWANLNTILMVVGPLLLEPGIDRHLDRPFRSDEGLARWDLAVDEMLKRGIYRSRHDLRARTRNRGKPLPTVSRTKKSGTKARRGMRGDQSED